MNPQELFRIANRRAAKAQLVIYSRAWKLLISVYGDHTFYVVAQQRRVAPALGQPSELRWTIAHLAREARAAIYR